MIRTCLGSVRCCARGGNGMSAASSATHASFAPALTLQHYLNPKLYLARRARFPAGETRIRDPSKVGSTHDTPGLAEICVVQDVEQFGPELDPHSIAYLSVLQNREVGVVEGRSDNNVAPKAAKARHC